MSITNQIERVQEQVEFLYSSASDYFHFANTMAIITKLECLNKVRERELILDDNECGFVEKVVQNPLHYTFICTRIKQKSTLSTGGKCEG